MAKNSDNIKEFLNEILFKLDFRFFKEISTIQKIKKNKNINSWDIDYYLIKWKRKYGLNENTVQKYFPIGHVINEIINIYQDLFGIKFEKQQNVKAWDPRIILYKIYDLSNDKRKLLGYFYLDLFNRKGKIKQTRCFSLQSPSIYPYGSNIYQPCVVVLVSSILQDDNSREHLLYHSDVLSLFHEFGHVVYQMLGKSKYSILTSSNVEFDFMQIPSLILDNMCWNPIIMKRLSKHYKSGEYLPDSIIKKMVKIRNLNIGIYHKKIVMSSIYDQLIHSSNDFMTICEDFLKTPDTNNKIDNIKKTLSNLYRQIHDQILRYIANDKIKIGFNSGTIFPNEFISVLIGNDARFYGLLWSKIYATDIYNEKFKDLQNLKKNGMEFRNEFLSIGGNIDGIEIIKKYLGRKPSVDGFLDFYGLEKNTEYSFFNTDKLSCTREKDFPTTTELLLSEDRNDNQKGQCNEELTDESYSNRFSEINDDEINKCTENSVQNKIYYIQNRIKLDEDGYITENTETLKKYNSIFIKN